RGGGEGGERHVGSDGGPEVVGRDERVVVGGAGFEFGEHGCGGLCLQPGGFAFFFGDGFFGGVVFAGAPGGVGVRGGGLVAGGFDEREVVGGPRSGRVDGPGHLCGGAAHSFRCGGGDDRYGFGDERLDGAVAGARVVRGDEPVVVLGAQRQSGEVDGGGLVADPGGDPFATGDHGGAGEFFVGGVFEAVGRRLVVRVDLPFEGDVRPVQVRERLAVDRGGFRGTGREFPGFFGLFAFRVFSEDGVMVGGRRVESFEFRGEELCAEPFDRFWFAGGFVPERGRFAVEHLAGRGLVVRVYGGADVGDEGGEFERFDEVDVWRDLGGGEVFWGAGGGFEFAAFFLVGGDHAEGVFAVWFQAADRFFDGLFFAEGLFLVFCFCAFAAAAVVGVAEEVAGGGFAVRVDFAVEGRGFPRYRGRGLGGRGFGSGGGRGRRGERQQQEGCGEEQYAGADAGVGRVGPPPGCSRTVVAHLASSPCVGVAARWALPEIGAEAPARRLAASPLSPRRMMGVAGSSWLGM